MVFVAGYALANAYLAYRFVGVFKAWLPVNGYAVGLCWLFLASAIIVFRDDSAFLPNGLTDVFYLTGAYWFALSCYAVLPVLLCDLANWGQKKLGLTLFNWPAQITGGALIAALLTIIAYGAYNAQNIRLTSYRVQLAHGTPGTKLRLAMVSDLHMGRIHGERSIARVVELVNGLDADLLVVAGDTVDSDLASLYRKRPLAGLSALKTRRGIYAVMGNHEYIQRRGPEAAEYLQSQGFNMLIDRAVELPHGVLLAGRDDYSQRFSKKNGAKPLVEILAGRGAGQPVILLEHQPARLAEAQAAGVDLLLCGHTHGGQMFPIQLLTRYMFPLDYGQGKFGALNMIVSSGVDSWGPPVRLGSIAEVVCVDIEFGKQ
jgi:predicted MPP superfamily phosphohydrolase